MPSLDHRKRKSDPPQSREVAAPPPAAACSEPPHPAKRPRTDLLREPSSPSRRRARPCKAAAGRTARSPKSLDKLQIDPGPSCSPPSPSPSTPCFELPQCPISTTALQIPPLKPLINRQTLQKLDLDIILTNAQLRHDLLFDAGLQFRPTSSQQKNALADAYWRAIMRELDLGCTCLTYGMDGMQHQTVVCACRSLPRPTTTSPSIYYSAQHRVLTILTPSRIGPLLAELLQVILYIIQPLPNPLADASPGRGASRQQTRCDAHRSSEEAYVRSILDPELIEQELRHASFDPSGLFRSIGQLLKRHCAPMRDAAVDAMVEAACSPTVNSGAVDAVRMCLDLLELMKLDIANHELQAIRPFLLRTSGQFELTSFQSLPNDLSLTRHWLQSVHRDLLASDHSPTPYRNIPANSQVLLSLLRGLTDLVFTPPETYPETIYLDTARLSILSTIAAHTTTIFMSLLLYRQLLSTSRNSPSGGPSHQVLPPKQDDLVQLKSELWEIWSSYMDNAKASEIDDGQEDEKWRDARRDLALQCAVHVQAQALHAPEKPDDRLQFVVPEQSLLRLAQRWADDNMRLNSPLRIMLRNRLRDAVFAGVVQASSYDGSKMKPREDKSLDPFVDEIQLLVGRIGKLADIHTNAYLPLYEKNGLIF